MKPLQNKAGNAGRMVQAEASSSLIFAALNQRVDGSSPSGSTNLLPLSYKGLRHFSPVEQ